MRRHWLTFHRVICFLIISSSSISFCKMVWDIELIEINDLKFHVKRRTLWDTGENFGYHDNASYGGRGAMLS